MLPTGPLTAAPPEFFISRLSLFGLFSSLSALLHVLPHVKGAPQPDLVHTPVILVPGRLTQGGDKYEASLGYDSVTSYVLKIQDPTVSTTMPQGLHFFS